MHSLPFSRTPGDDLPQQLPRPNDINFEKTDVEYLLT